MSEIQDALRRLAPFDLPDGLLDRVEAAYGAPPRSYHTFGHVLDVAERFDEVARGPGWQRPREVFMAVLFHDAVYIAGRSDNEARSADQVREVVAECLAATGLDEARVRELILATARHGSISPAEVDADASHFLDCDMAILGAAPARFLRYDRAIAEEYAGTIPGEIFHAGRRAFLERLLARERIFLSDFFRDRLESAARANLLAALSAS